MVSTNKRIKYCVFHKVVLKTTEKRVFSRLAMCNTYTNINRTVGKRKKKNKNVSFRYLMGILHIQHIAPVL